MRLGDLAAACGAAPVAGEGTEPLAGDGAEPIVGDGGDGMGAGGRKLSSGGGEDAPAALLAPVPVPTAKLVPPLPLKQQIPFESPLP